MKRTDQPAIQHLQGGSHAPTQTMAAAVLPFVVLVTGCVGAPGAPAPGGLVYGDPDPNPSTYTFTDTTTFAIEAPGYGVMEVETARRGTAELHFRPAPDGYRVRVRFPELAGSFRTGTQGTVRANEADIGGPVEVELSPRGDVAVVDTPAMSTVLLEISGPESLVRPFFVQLPGRAVAPGDRWVDTVRTREDRAGTVSRGTNIITATLLGDTVVAGRRLLRIDTETMSAVKVTGMSGGVQVEQELSGTLNGRILWDDRANLLVERTDEGELSGTLDMPGTGVAPMPISARVRRRTLLRP